MDSYIVPGLDADRRWPQSHSTGTVAVPVPPCVPAWRDVWRTARWGLRLLFGCARKSLGMRHVQLDFAILPSHYGWLLRSGELLHQGPSSRVEHPLRTLDMTAA